MGQSAYSWHHRSSMSRHPSIAGSGGFKTRPSERCRRFGGRLSSSGLTTTGTEARIDLSRRPHMARANRRQTWPAARPAVICRRSTVTVGSTTRQLTPTTGCAPTPPVERVARTAPLWEEVVERVSTLGMNNMVSPYSLPKALRNVTFGSTCLESG